MAEQPTTEQPRQLRDVHDGLMTQDEWRRLCLRAFENLPRDTAVTMDDVDAILTWCLPAYDDALAAAGRLHPKGASTEWAVDLGNGLPPYPQDDEAHARWSAAQSPGAFAVTRNVSPWRRPVSFNEEIADGVAL